MSMETWTIIGVIVAVIGVASAWGFYFRPHGTANTGDGAVKIGKGAEVGHVTTKVVKTANTSSSADGSIDTGTGSKAGNIATNVSKTDGSNK